MYDDLKGKTALVTGAGKRCGITACLRASSGVVRGSMILLFTICFGG
ncbi:MAG: hypothetical protein WAL98_00185 [Desulfatiglandaceae bacterium]